MIKVTEFCKAYDDEIAVNQISFGVAAGEVLGLIGPNGAGKTTTLRALAGIIPFNGGKLSVANFDVETNPIAVKQRTAYVPDDPQLFNDLSVAQHLAFVASVYGVPDWRQQMQQLLERFELTQKVNAKASALSRGMRQKLAICCAYLYRPDALLLDEPMTGLDPHGIRVLKESIRGRADSGAAVIISSHLLAMVEDICTHVLILDVGKQNFYGTIDQLRSTYAQSDASGTLEEIFFRAVASQPGTVLQSPKPIVQLPSDVTDSQANLPVTK